MPKIIDLTGQRFGRLTVIEKTTDRTREGSVVYICKCDCGNITNTSGYYLKKGITKSCGCLRRERCINNPRPLKTNKYTGIRNISLRTVKGFVYYRVLIVRENNTYNQNFHTLQEAERAKECVLSRYKKGLSNWNAKL